MLECCTSRCVHAYRESLAREEQTRREALEKLERLRKRHEADKESARRTYMESKRWVVVLLLLHLHGVEDVDRGDVAISSGVVLFW